MRWPGGFWDKQTLADLRAVAQEDLGQSALAQDLFDCLLDGQISLELGERWAKADPPLPPAPNPERAALARGFLLAAQRDLLILNDPPAPADKVSMSRAEVEAGLIGLAGRLSPDAVQVVANADYGHRSEEHAAALRQMLETDFAHVPLKERWVPMEVIELVSHVPGDFGHLPCLAIVLLDAVRNGDAYGAADFRWTEQYAHIKAQPPDIAAPLIAAFRHLWETVEEWDTFLDFKAGRIPDRGLFPPATRCE